MVTDGSASTATSVNKIKRSPRVPALAEVRHERGRRSVKSFRISLGSRRVCTTFAIEFEAFGKAETELLEKGFLRGGGFSDAAQADLTAVGGGQDDVGALQGQTS